MVDRKQNKLNQLYIDIADRIAQMSYAVRKKVGAIIVKDSNIISMGWNGMPTGYDNNCELPDGTTNPLVLHAELNSLIKLTRSTSSSEGATLYVTMSPCPECAKLIIQAGIKQVFYKHQYRLTHGLEILNRAKIPCIQLTQEEPDNVYDRARQTPKSSVRRKKPDAGSWPFEAPEPRAVKLKDRARKG